MYIDKITKEEEQCINDILSDGIDEIKDITKSTSTQPKPKPLFKSSNYINDIPLQSKIQITDLNLKRDSTRENAPKSSALRDLIDQLKKENNYILSSDDDEQRHQFQAAKKQQKTINADIDHLEQSTSQFNAMKNQMDFIQKRIQKVSNRIDMNNEHNKKTVTHTNRSYSYTQQNISTKNRSCSNEDDRSSMKRINAQTQKLNQIHMRNTKKTSESVRNSTEKNYNDNNTKMMINRKNKAMIQRVKVKNSRDYHNNDADNNNNNNSNESSGNEKDYHKHKQCNTYTINHHNHKPNSLTLKGNYLCEAEDNNNDEDNYTFNQGSPINNQSKQYITKSKHKAKPRLNMLYHSESTLLSKFSWKKKYDDLYSKQQHQLSEITAEEIKINNLQHQIKVTNKKNSNYNKLIEYSKQLVNQDELLFKQIYESENIRKEQSKLIRSLQREIDMLRGDVDESNLNNIAEIYQSMKESLINSQSQSASMTYMLNSQKNISNNSNN